MLSSDPIECIKDCLQNTPTTDRLDEAAIFHLAPIVDIGGKGFGPVEPALRNQATCQRAIGKEANAIFKAESAHLLRRTPVQQREGNLVGNDWNAMSHQNTQMRGVEIGNPEMANESFV